MQIFICILKKEKIIISDNHTIDMDESGQGCEVVGYPTVGYSNLCKYMQIAHYVCKYMQKKKRPVKTG